MFRSLKLLQAVWVLSFIEIIPLIGKPINDHIQFWGKTAKRATRNRIQFQFFAAAFATRKTLHFHWSDTIAFVTLTKRLNLTAKKQRWSCCAQYPGNSWKEAFSSRSIKDSKARKVEQSLPCAAVPPRLKLPSGLEFVFFSYIFFPRCAARVPRAESLFNLMKQD